MAQSNWAIQNPENSDERQANQLILQRRHIPTTPAYNPQIHSPVTHPQRAKVVGPEGEEIYVDEWGVLKSASYLRVVMTIAMMVEQEPTTMIPIQLGLTF